MAKRKEEKTNKIPPGHKHVWVTLPEGEHKELRVAAAVAGVPMSQFVRDAAVKEARRVNGREKP